MSNLNSYYKKKGSDGTGQNLTSTNSSSSNDLSTLRMVRMKLFFFKTNSVSLRAERD